MKKGTILYSLYPGGAPGYAVTIATVNQAKGSAQKFHDLVQVTPGWDKDLGKMRDMRYRVTKYVVQNDICVAKGKANPNFTFKDKDGNVLGKDPHTYSGGGNAIFYS